MVDPRSPKSMHEPRRLSTLKGTRFRATWMSFKSQGFGSWIALSIFLSVVVSTVLSWVLLQGFQREFPDVTLLKQRYPVVIYSGRGKPFTVGWRSQRPMQWVSLGQISRVALGAVVVSEDWSFYSHKGYDPVAIREAIVEDLEEGRFARGASTLTQQVAKNVFLERDKTLWRKFKELWLALELEEKVGKKRILETYFNIAEWGEGIFGIQAASRHYFRKTPSELTAREGAFLAMLLPSPKKYSISYRQGNLTRYARRTVHSILLKMWRGGYLSETEYRAALASRMGFEGPAETETDSEKDQTDIDETATEEETEDGSDGAETEAPSAESVSSGADSRGSEDETEKAQQPSESRDSE